MGLIKAAKSAIGTTMHEQWKDLISCENMDNEVLMVRKTTDTGVISKKSIIRVLPGQCAVIMQNGKVLDASAEEGDYNFDESVTPSFFAGNFGEVFKEMWQRFTFGGSAVDEQAVYYFNTKEIMDNKFGTATPIPFQDWEHSILNQITGELTPLLVRVKCYGKYTFKISDPALFMKEIAGTAEIYKKEQITEQIKTEVISAFQNIVNELGTKEHKIPASALPSQTDEIKELMDARVYDGAIRKRGLNIIGFAVESVTLDQKSEEDIANYLLSANAKMQQGVLTAAYAEAVKKAASNSNGAANGFMGIGLMNMAGGSVFGNTLNNSAAQASQNTENVVVAAGTNANSWKCTNCGKENTGKFCAECGTKKVENEKVCSKCGNKVDNNTKFCSECGEKLQ